MFNKSTIYKIIAAFISLLLFVAIMDKIVMPWYVDLGDELEMPDVVQNNINEAKFTLEKQGFIVHIADSVFDANFSEGTVVEQMPIPYSTVKTGRNVYLTVSIGDKPIIMPNLFGMSPRDAQLKLTSLELELRTNLQVYNDLYPAGVVIGQSFPKGEQISKNSKVTITVSLGKMPANKKIPNLIGKSLSTARQQLRQLDVKIENIEYEENNSYLPNTVLKQSLREGLAIKEDTAIELTVSKLED